MTSTATFAPPATSRRNHRDVWASVDAALLILLLIVSSDMLIRVGVAQQLAWMACYALTLLRVAMLWPHFLVMALRNKVVFAYPLACLASVLWSYTPLESLIAAAQLTITMIIAMYIGWRYSLVVITKTLAVVLSVAFALSLLHWATGIFPWPVFTNEGGLGGIFSSKNQLGQRTMFAMIAILTIWVLPRSAASPRFKLALPLLMLLALISLSLSHSATSLLMTPVLISIWFILCRHWLPRSIVFPAAGVAIILATLGPVLLSVYAIDPVASVLDAVGKSSTLTGRTILWEIGRDVSSKHPILGVGYNSFWNAPEFFNERLAMRQTGGASVAAFHNFPLEILVSAGWPALIAMLSLIFAAVLRLFRLYNHFGSAPAAGGLVMVVAIVVASLTGSSLFRGHEAMIVLLVALMVSAQEDYIARLSSLQRPGRSQT